MATPVELRLEKEVKAINGRLEALHEQKRRIIVHWLTMMI
jgi:hypothetical protein